MSLVLIISEKVSRLKVKRLPRETSSESSNSIQGPLLCFQHNLNTRSDMTSPTKDRPKPGVITIHTHRSLGIWLDSVPLEQRQIERTTKRTRKKNEFQEDIIKVVKGAKKELMAERHSFLFLESKSCFQRQSPWLRVSFRFNELDNKRQKNSVKKNRQSQETVPGYAHYSIAWTFATCSYQREIKGYEKRRREKWLQNPWNWCFIPS
jgi:hypothetical protein